MKVYIVSWLAPSGNQLAAFTNKQKALKLYKELEKDKENECIFDIKETEFPLSKQSIIDALELGANFVYK